MSMYATTGRHSHAANTGYGWRDLRGKKNFHKGIDYTSHDDLTQYLDENKSATILFAGWDKAGGGNMVWWKYDDGTGGYYLHSETLFVKTGQRVAPNTPLAKEGSTGNSTGRHTHHVKLKNGSDLNSHHNFTLEDRKMFKKFSKPGELAIITGREDLIKYVAAGGDINTWFWLKGYTEFIAQLGYLEDWTKIAEFPALDPVHWIETYLLKEYPSGIWKAKRKEKETIDLNKEAKQLIQNIYQSTSNFLSKLK